MTLQAIGCCCKAPAYTLWAVLHVLPPILAAVYTTGCASDEAYLKAMLPSIAVK